MSPETDLVEKLRILNHIADTLNQAVDVRSVLEQALADVVKLMTLETAWISIRQPSGRKGRSGGSWVLAAHQNLPPALDAESGAAWQGTCSCQDLCREGRLTEAYNEVQCSRLARAHGDRRGLAVHATAPLRSGSRSLGILNVAAPDWEAFSPEALSLLTNVGSQMGAALERARLYDLVRDRRLHQQSALLEFSDRLLRQRDLDDLMGYLVREVRQMLSADASALLLPTEGSGFLEFRASSGWRVDPREGERRIPADGRSGPGRVLQTRVPIVVEDLLDGEPRRWLPAWLRSEGFRGHAVVPLVVDEHSIGVLVINHRQPKLLQEDDVQSLQLMANQAAIAIEKARLHDEEVKMLALENELEIGRQIQLSLLPEAPPVAAGWEFAAFYQAAREVGGDFYDFFTVPGPDHRLGLSIADVTGKGVPAALFMSRAHTMIRTSALSGLGPAGVLEQVNELILDARRVDLLITAFYAILEIESGKLIYANAGHCRPLWLPAGATECQDLPSHGILLGAFPGINLKEHRVDVAHGDLLVFYTDGVTEAMNANRDPFGEERLHGVVSANAGASVQKILEAIIDAVRSFADGTARSDDLTLVVVRRRPISQEEGSLGAAAGATRPDGNESSFTARFALTRSLRNGMRTLQLFADLSQLSAIRGFVARNGRDLALDESVIWDLQLAVDEACTNVVQHAYSGHGGEIEITIERDKESVCVIIHWWGTEFDPQSAPAPDVTVPLENRPLGGLGLFLIRQVMDQASYQFDGDRGNSLTMMKRL